jgi:hypothetical protein
MGDFDGKTLKLKQGDIHIRVRGVLTAVIWNDKQDVCILTNMHKPQEEGNFCDEYGRAHKPTIEDYNWHMGYVDNEGQNV